MHTLPAIVPQEAVFNPLTFTTCTQTHTYTHDVPAIVPQEAVEADVAQRVCDIKVLLRARNAVQHEDAFGKCTTESPRAKTRPTCIAPGRKKRRARAHARAERLNCARNAMQLHTPPQAFSRALARVRTCILQAEMSPRTSPRSQQKPNVNKSLTWGPCW
jgi:hypothetical protein